MFLQTFAPALIPETRHSIQGIVKPQAETAHAVAEAVLLRHQSRSCTSELRSRKPACEYNTYVRTYVNIVLQTARTFSVA